jgi:hypothetical protein
VLAQAASTPTIYTGPNITFTRADDVDGSLPANQDCITTHVCLARLNIMGLFNSKLESSFTDFSPHDTEWAFQGLGGNPNIPAAITATNYANLTFDDFADALDWYVGDYIVNRPAVLHLIADNVYLNIKFTSWTRGTSEGESGRGGFSYVRATPGGATVVPTVVPTLSTWGLILLAFLLMVVAGWMFMRKQRPKHSA